MVFFAFDVFFLPARRLKLEDAFRDPRPIFSGYQALSSGNDTLGVE